MKRKGLNVGKHTIAVFILNMSTILFSCGNSDEIDQSEKLERLKTEYGCVLWDELNPGEYSHPLSLDLDSILLNNDKPIYIDWAFLRDIYSENSELHAIFENIGSFPPVMHLDLKIDDAQCGQLRSAYYGDWLVSVGIVVKITSHYRPKFYVHQLIEEADPYSSEILIEGGEVLVLSGTLLKLVSEKD